MPDLESAPEGIEPEDMPSTDILLLSIATSLKRIADALDSSESGGRPQGSVVWWLENIAAAADRAAP